MAWQGMARYGTVWYGMVWYGMVWYGMVWCGVVCVVWCGVVWYSMVWYGMAWHGTVWYGKKIFYACTIRTKSDQLRYDSLQHSPILSGNYLSMKIYTHKLGRFKRQKYYELLQKTRYKSSWMIFV